MIWQLDLLEELKKIFIKKFNNRSNNQKSSKLKIKTLSKYKIFINFNKQTEKSLIKSESVLLFIDLTENQKQKGTIYFDKFKWGFPIFLFFYINYFDWHFLIESYPISNQFSLSQSVNKQNKFVFFCLFI